MFVKECERCPELAACRKQIVNNKVDNPHALIMGVGQNPGEDEDNTGTPFVGKAGKLLRHVCDAARIPVRDFFRTNAARCHSPGNRVPKWDELENCHDYLIQEIGEVGPKVIIALGASALTSLFAIPAYREAMRLYAEGPLADWEAECARLHGAKAEELERYARDLVEWESLGRAARGPKPRKPGAKVKLPSKPKPPKKPEIKLGSVSGQVLVQPETGIYVIPTYHPSWFQRGKFDRLPLIIAHFERARRLATGAQPLGELGEYKTVTTIEELEALRDYLLSPGVERIYFDTETTGLSWMDDELICISLAGCAGEGYVVPILQQGGDLFEGWRGKLPQVIAVLREIFGSDKPKEAQNTVFDLAMLERDRASMSFVEALTSFGIEVRGYLGDTEQQHQMVAESLPHNMTSVLATHTDMPYYEEEIHRLSKGKKDMISVLNEVLWRYSAADADGLARIHDALRPIIESEGTDYVLEQIAQPILRLCWNMQKRGLPIDLDYFERLCRYYDKVIAEAEEVLWETVPQFGRDWKYTDPGTLKDILFVQLGLPTSGRKTKSSRGCQACADGTCFDHDQTGKDALRDVYQVVPHPIIPCILNLKSLTKVKSTYLDGGKGGWKRHIRSDGRIHPIVQVSRAETGRLAFKTPSAQNPPKGVKIDDDEFDIHSDNAFRDVIRAGGQGKTKKVILNADWNQLEVWGLAYFLSDHFGDRTLLDVLESGKDVHTFAARGMWPDVDPELDDHAWRQVHGDLRSKAKVFVFGTNYGLTVEGTMERIGCDEPEAKELIERYMTVVPGLRRYKDYIRRAIIEQGYVEDIFGRRRHTPQVPILRALNENGEFEAVFREALNMPIQGGGSDLHSFASVATDYSKALQKRGCFAILSVHDSLTFEADAPDNDYVLQTAWLIRDLWAKIAWNMPLADGTPLHWKVPCEIEWGETWGSPRWKLNAHGVLEDLREGADDEAA